MTAEDIITQLKTILTNDNTLKTYIKAIFVGDRQRIYGDTFPCIVIEVISDRLIQRYRGNIVENNLEINIIPAVQISDRDKALIGDATIKGIIDVISHIKTAINSQYPSLNKKCLYFDLSTEEIGDFPDLNGKYAVIKMNVMYREAI